MFRLHVIQARWGDSLLLEYGEDILRYVLIDGGPESAYTRHLLEKLTKIRDNRSVVDLAILTHVDSDHVEGLIEIMRDLEKSQHSVQINPVEIKRLWHNSFSGSLRLNARINTRMMQILESKSTLRRVDPVMTKMIKSIRQGDLLWRFATELGIPINEQFSGGPVTSDICSRIEWENMSLDIIGPTMDNLEKLRREWLKWLEEEGLAIRDHNLRLKTQLTPPNLSSIMFLAKANDKSVLLTGDGHSDDILEGLSQMQLLNKSNSLHVNVMKIPHHGSKHNVTKNFFERVTADRYVISASGRYGHPSFQTLVWIVESTKDRDIEILATNETRWIKKLVNEYDQASYRYKLVIMPKTAHSIIVDCIKDIVTFDDYN